MDRDWCRFEVYGSSALRVGLNWSAEFCGGGAVLRGNLKLFNFGLGG